MPKEKDDAEWLQSEQTRAQLRSSEIRMGENIGVDRQDSNDPNIGTTIADRYRVEKLIGEGGMASVYEATHIVLKKRLAIKILHRNIGNSNEAIIRFQQEASGLSHLEHPNLVSILDFGLNEAGHPYCVMDMVDGEPLSELIEERELPNFGWLANIFSQVSDALAYAHKQNVIHRDIKPSNIICLKTDGKWTAKLIDFGIAKFGEFQSQELTRTGAIFGSPFYMSPEQSVGAKLDQRSDIYSLGCTMYEALTGRPPFVGKSALQTLSMHASENPLPPHVVNRAVPPGFEKIILKCIEKDQENRYRSARDLQNSLDKVDLRTTARLILDRSAITIVCLSVVVALVWFGVKALHDHERADSMDEKQILKVEDADYLRHRIANDSKNPALNKRTLAALYYRLIMLDSQSADAPTEEDCTKGYHELISPTIKNVSLYTFEIAAYLSYVESISQKFALASERSHVALDIYEKAVADGQDLSSLLPQATNCSNIIVTNDLLTQPVDTKRVSEQISRSIKICSTMEKQSGDKDKSDTAAVYIEMARRCEVNGDLEDSVICYRQAAYLYGVASNEKRHKEALLQCEKVKAKMAQSQKNR